VSAYAPDCCPNYLKPEHQTRLQAHADRITMHTTTITRFLRQHPGQYTHFLLLDHQDWLAGHDPAALVEEWEQILSNSRRGAKILLRSAAAMLEFLPAFVLSALRFFPERTEAPHRQDRVGTYRSLHLAEVL
jgi:S-adenosylmethionine-diacylglycerol 3-amino-3-carboxypropyl transferase